MDCRFEESPEPPLPICSFSFSMYGRLRRFGFALRQLRLAKPGSFEDFAELFGVWFDTSEQDNLVSIAYKTLAGIRAKPRGSVGSTISSCGIRNADQQSFAQHAITDTESEFSEVRIIRRGKRIYYLHRPPWARSSTTVDQKPLDPR